jgi:beta-phosphoglucomutase-like phosphatase (HAD superfamily)
VILLKGIVFDFNGVLLWDTHLHDIAWKEYSKKLRGTVLTDEEMVHKVHGRTNKDVLEYLTGKTVEGEELQSYVEGKESMYRQSCLESSDEFKLAPGAIEFLDYLKDSKKPINIATSSEIGNLEFFFQHLPLSNWFDFNRVAYDDGTIKGKPEPDLYLRGASNLGLEPAECIVVEDARSGIQSAYNAHVGKIIALGPKEKQHELSDVKGVNQIITDFNDLLNDKNKLWTKTTVEV